MNEITKEQIEWERQRRMRECSQRIAQALQELECDLQAVPEIVDGRIVANVQIVSKR